MQKQFQFAYQLINKKIVENDFIPTKVKTFDKFKKKFFCLFKIMDKNCEAARNNSSRYNHGYSCRGIEIQVVLLKQTNYYLLTIEVSNIFTLILNVSMSQISE